MRIKTLLDTCNRLGVNVNCFAPKSYRLTKKGYGTIDFYPKKMRVFFHEDQVWEDATNIIRFLEFEFK